MANRVFLRNEKSGECGFYGGELSDMAGVLKNIGHMLAADLPEELEADGDAAYVFYVKDMTDEEVAALPDM